MYNNQYTISNIQYTIYNIQFTIYNLQYTIYNIQYILYNIKYTLGNWRITVNIQCAVASQIKFFALPSRNKSMESMWIREPKFFDFRRKVLFQISLSFHIRLLSTKKESKPALA